MTLPVPPRLFSFGHGYSARALARRLLAEGWQVVASVPAARGDRTELLLVLAPPRPVAALRVPRELYLLAALACAACGALGALLATIIH